MDEQSWYKPAKCSPFRPTCRTRPKPWKTRLIWISSILRAPIGSTGRIVTYESEIGRGEAGVLHIPDEGVRGDMTCSAILILPQWPNRQSNQKNRSRHSP